MCVDPAVPRGEKLQVVSCLQLRRLGVLDDHIHFDDEGRHLTAVVWKLNCPEAFDLILDGNPSAQGVPFSMQFSSPGCHVIY